MKIKLTLFFCGLFTGIGLLWTALLFHLNFVPGLKPDSLLDEVSITDSLAHMDKSTLSPERRVRYAFSVLSHKVKLECKADVFAAAMHSCAFRSEEIDVSSSGVVGGQQILRFPYGVLQFNVNFGSILNSKYIVKINLKGAPDDEPAEEIVKQLFLGNPPSSGNYYVTAYALFYPHTTGDPHKGGRTEAYTAWTTNFFPESP